VIKRNSSAVAEKLFGGGRNNVVLCLTTVPSRQRQVEVRSHNFLASGLNSGECSEVPAALLMGKKNPPSPGTHWVGGWVGHTASLYITAKRGNATSARDGTLVQSISNTFIFRTLYTNTNHKQFAWYLQCQISYLLSTSCLVHHCDMKCAVTQEHKLHLSLTFRIMQAE